MALAAEAIALRLDPAKDFRPWFMLRGQKGIPAKLEHASWDLGDMTGRYLEGLIMTRHMGVSRPEFSKAEGRLQKYFLKILGPDGMVIDPDSKAVDHSFSQGSALYGLLAWWEDSGDPTVRTAIERLISGMLRRMHADGKVLVDPTAKLERASGSHLTGYGIWPIIRFYELTGYPDALKLAEGLSQWALSDPVLGADDAITLALSWEGHIHSWLDTLAGCARTAKNSNIINRDQAMAKCRAVYDWVKRSNATEFGWIATFPTHGSSETCAISSAIRLALELADAGYPEYYNDVERFVRNQVIEAQFKDIHAYETSSVHPTPLLIGCFDSQSMPNGHLGTRGGEDVGTVEGCCLNGGMRALALAWSAIQRFDENGVTVNLRLTMNGPAAEIIGYEPFDGRVDVIPRAPGAVKIRLPDWTKKELAKVFVNDKETEFKFEADPDLARKSTDRPARAEYILLPSVSAGARVSVRYSLRNFKEDVTAGGKTYRVHWKGDSVVEMTPKGEREPAYRNRLKPRESSISKTAVPDTYELQDAARLASMSMLARLDLHRAGQPFFRIYPFANPPRAEHEKWDDGDMAGRYTEALILARRMTGIPMDPRENLLRSYLAKIYDTTDGLCYTQGTEWTPRRACMFSQSSAMLGLLEWYRDTGSFQARQLLDRQVNGLMKIAVDRGHYVYFPKYEWDGKQFVDEPKGEDAPTWYGGRLILPLVEYWKMTGRSDVREFVEKLVRYSTEVSKGIKPDGEVVGKSWWSHLHSTMDMAAGIAEFGRLNHRPELVAWAKRVYDWVGRECATRYGWVSDIAHSSICESCAIASRFRLGLALYRAGAVDPFGEIDRHLRNQLLENQFVNLDFLWPLDPAKPRTERTNYAGIDRMLRGTFQCWGTANDLIGHDDIEGCGAGGGVQGLALAWASQCEWRGAADEQELRINLLFNCRIRGPAAPPFTNGVPVAAELWSYLPYEGRVVFKAHQPIARAALRLPDGSDLSRVRIRRGDKAAEQSAPVFEGQHVILRALAAGEAIEMDFGLNRYSTREVANQAHYAARWKGSAVVDLDPRGNRVPLYADRAGLITRPTPLTAPRYP